MAKSKTVGANKHVGTGGFDKTELELGLHRQHMYQKSTRLEFTHPDLGMTWRSESGSHLPNGAKELIAYRLAVCWNVLEGIPTEALMSGVLRDIVHAVTDKDYKLAERLIAKLDGFTDAARGRLHDCRGCLAKGEEE